MLKAITHSKAGRVSSGNGQQSERWKDIYQQREDLMTAAVFSRFAYLSEPLQNQILSAWFGINANQKTFYGFEDIIFWPSYKLTLEDETTSRVEPDILLIFEESYVLVEVKPPQGGDQYLQQWRREIESFLQDSMNHKPTERKKKLHFLALGRIDQNDADKWFKSLKAEFDDEIELCAALRWQPATNHLLDLEVAKATDRRVLADIFEALALYGLRTKIYKWSELLEGIESGRMPELSLSHSLLLDEEGLRSGTFKSLDQDSLPTLEALNQFINTSPNLNLQGMSSWTITK